MARYRYIAVPEDVYLELLELRRELGARSWGELLRLLVEGWRVVGELRVRDLVCNELRETRAAYQAWVRILASRGLRVREIEQAVAYLKPTADPHILEVDVEKCAKQHTAVGEAG